MGLGGFSEEGRDRHRLYGDQARCDDSSARPCLWLLMGLLLAITRPDTLQAVEGWH